MEKARYSPMFRIRPAHTRDLDQIVEVNRRPGLSHWSKSEYERYLIRVSIFTVVESKSPQERWIAGFALATIIEEDIELLKLAIDPDQQGKGLGRLLLDKVLQSGTEAGCDRCLLEVSTDNLPAIRFYYRQGFTILYKRKDYYLRPPGDALVLQRRLQGSGSIDESKG